MLLGMMMLLGWIVILVATAFFLHFYMEYVYSDTSFLNSLKAMNRGFMYIGRTLAILLISHDMNVVRRLCEDVAVMYKGKIVERGLTEDIFHNPQDEYTKRLIAAIPTRKRHGQA